MSSVFTYKDFQVLLFQLSERLNRNEIVGIINIESLPAELEGQGALKVLLKLQMLGRISDTKPSYLQEVFSNVNRIDLAQEVDRFSKRSKRKTKKAAAAAQEKDLSLTANLEVTAAQMRLLQDQLEHLHKTAQESGSRNMEAQIADIKMDAECLAKKLRGGSRICQRGALL